METVTVQVFLFLSDSRLFLKIKTWTLNQFLDATVFSRFREAISAIGEWQASDVRVFGVSQRSPYLTVNLVVVDRAGRVTRSVFCVFEG
jgi:hypothetical protein